jgi:hypothetical protein
MAETLGSEERASASLLRAGFLKAQSALIARADFGRAIASLGL